MSFENEVLEKISFLFENTPKELISPETNFLDLQEWDSLMLLSIIALLDRDFGYKFRLPEIEKCQTFGHLLAIVENQTRSN